MKLAKFMLSMMMFAATLSAHSAPLVRYFELTTEPSQQAEFDAVGVHNLSTSIETENGTLAMYALKHSEQPNLNYVFEIYQDEAAYQTHAQSPQFKQFVELAKTAVMGRKVMETEPQFLAEKTEPIRLTQHQLKVNFAEVQVKPEWNDQFKAIVLDEMQQSLAKEQGVLAMYAVTLKDQPNEWRFFEIYADENAYSAHRASEHFQHYLSATAEMVSEKKLISLQGGTLMNKGGMQFVAK